MTVLTHRGADVPQEVSLKDLISLEDAGFEDAEECNRGLEEEHVQQLALSDIKGWPALDVVSVGTPQKYAVIDGRHRWEAAKRLKLETIMVKAGNYNKDAEVIEAAFRANLKNGRAASSSERTVYALWLFWQDPSTKPNLSAIARKVGLHPSVVNRAINKELKRLDDEEKAEKEGTSVAEIAETQRLLKAIRRYLENEVAFFSGQHGERSVKKRAASLLNHLNTMEDKGKQNTAVQDLRTLTATLNQISWNDQENKRKNA